MSVNHSDQTLPESFLVESLIEKTECTIVIQPSCYLLQVHLSNSSKFWSVFGLFKKYDSL